MRTNRIKNKKPPKCGRFLTNHILNPNYLNYSKWCIKSNKKQPAYISWRFHSNCLALPAHTLEEHVHLFQRWYFLDFQVLAVLGGHVFPATKMKESECLAKNSTSQIKDGFPVDKLIASFQRPDHCLLKCYSTYLTTQKKLPKKKKKKESNIPLFTFKKSFEWFLWEKTILTIYTLWGKMSCFVEIIYSISKTTESNRAWRYFIFIIQLVTEK